MDLSGLFILANDIEFIPAESVAEKAKKGFDHGADDVFITQLNSRKTSKLISKDMAIMLEEFRSPRSFAEVIWSFSERKQRDSQQVADEVFGSLITMKDWGFIIPYDAEDDTSKKVSLQAGDKFRNYTIIQIIRNFQDTEVYKVENASGEHFALKLIKANSSDHFNALFDQEIYILRLLDGMVNPVFVEQGIDGENKFLVSSWCDGNNCLNEAMKWQNINSRDNLIHLIDLCISILAAYKHLHDQKVFHGDINPDNILISAAGKAWIVDFGYATFENNERKMLRGGIGYYYEPEFAISVITNQQNPALTKKAEQYSIAVLLYKILSGNHYLDFSVEKDKMYQQIAYDEPLSFKHYDLALPGELEKILRIALAKDPGKRFSSLEDFANALAQVKINIADSNRLYIYNKQNTGEQLVSFLLQKFGWDSEFIDKGLSLAPASSTHFGNAGIAYMFYRISCVQESANLSDLADIWINRALKYKNDYDHAFFSTALDVNEKIVGKNSLYHSPAGIYLAQALIGNSRNDRQSFFNGLDGYLSIAALPSSKIDLALGSTGLLIGYSLLYKELQTITQYSPELFIAAAEKIKNEIWQELDNYPPMNESNGISYFGIAHGWAGILYATLLWCHTASCELPVSYMKRVEELASSSVSNANGIYWPLNSNDSNPWPGWCNGNAGHIFLWTLLYKHFKEEKYIHIAEQTVAHLLTMKYRNTDLCCGMSGINYAMMNLYKITGDKKYLQEAQKIKQMILENWFRQPLRNNSLYKGEVGIGILMSEMDMPSLTRMPLFEI